MSHAARRIIDPRSLVVCALGLVLSLAATPSRSQTLLSQGKPAVASSVESSSYPASYAVDGNTSTRWSSAYSDPQWVRVDLGVTASISRVVLRWETAYGRAFQIQVSNDASSWTTLYSTTTGAGGVNDLTVSGSGRYLRLYGTQRGTAWGYSLWELQVYGTTTGGGVLLSQGKPAVASSVESSSYPASYAVDGSTSTRWSSAYSDPQWIRVDLGAVASISRVVLRWETAYGRAFQLQVSNDASSWTTIYSTTSGAGGVNDLTVSGSGRYLRMYGTQRGTAWGYSLWELEVYGSGGGPVCSTLPGVPTGLNSPSQTTSSVSLSWNAATPGANCTVQYRVFMNGAQMTQLGGTSTTIGGLAANTSYSFTVAAINEYGSSAQSGAISVRTAGAASGKVLGFFNSIVGTRTVAGQHNKEPNSQPAASTNQIVSITGRYPGLWSGDFLFGSGSVESTNRWTMIYEAQRQWDNHALVNIMWHACPPTQSEPCGWDGGVVSTLTNAQWTDLTTDGGTLNTAWKRRLDVIAPYLQYLEDNGVEVLWRPLHEVNQGVFWWAGRPGASGTARLYQITHDYLVNTKGLGNLVWVWDIQDFWSNAGSATAIASDIQAYNPGASYWDVLALDPYSTGFTQQNYDAMRSVAGSKPIAIGECQFVPSSSLLASQPRWVFFMLWPDFISSNTSALPALYGASNVLTRDEMPGW